MRVVVVVIAVDIIRIDVVCFDGLVQDCGNSSVLAMELLHSCTKPSSCLCYFEMINMKHPTHAPNCDHFEKIIPCREQGRSSCNSKPFTILYILCNVRTFTGISHSPLYMTAPCLGNSIRITGRCLVDSLHKWPVMRSFDYFFVVNLSKLWTNEASESKRLNAHMTSLQWRPLISYWLLTITAHPDLLCDVRKLSRLSSLISKQ